MIARELISLPSYAQEVREGLLQVPKALPSKLFYDERGSALFEEITRLPEYYLTQTELKILRDKAESIADAVQPGSAIVELGAGTAAKTCTLLNAFARRQLRVRYYPVDISSAALNEARERVLRESPQVSFRPVIADFSGGFRFLSDIPHPKLVLYLGSSIGNFDLQSAVNMLGEVRTYLSPGDALLLGTDLAKDSRFLLPAYDDAQGVTAEFNRNLLYRLNAEFNGNFNPRLFRHIAMWNRKDSRMEMHLESACKQDVELRLMGLQVHFAAGERIHTENSYKYTQPMIDEILTASGFQRDKTWTDSKNWFALHLARPRIS